MSKSINQVFIMGNLTRDPELRSTTSGQEVASFSLALNRSYKGKNDEWQEATDYVDVTAWGNLAGKVKSYLKQGGRALVEGRLQNNQWTDNDGQKRSKMEVVASNVTFLDRDNQA